MKISSYYIFINHTFIPGPAVISLSVQNFTQRFVIVDAGSSTVIFKAYYRHFEKITLQNNITDQAAFFLLGVHVDQTQAFDHALFCLVVAPEQLISTAYCNDNTVILHICLKIFLERF